MLIDIKEAGKAAAATASNRRMPKDNARRVVQGARHLSPNLGDRMVPAKLLDKSVVLRELMPQDLKIEMDQFGRAEAVRSARYLASVVGAAHARQMSKADRLAWEPAGASRPPPRRQPGRAQLAVTGQRGRAVRAPRGGIPGALPPLRRRRPRRSG